MKFSSKKYIFEKEYALSKQTIWHLLSDTNRVNLYIGLFPAEFSSTKKNKSGSLYRLGNGLAKGFIPIRWEDYPFEWEKEKISSVSRLYLSGPIKQYKGTIELYSDKDSLKTKVRMTVEFTPRTLAGLAAIPIVCHQNIQKKFEYLDKYIAAAKENFYSLPQKNLKHKVNTSELNQLIHKLKKSPVEEEHTELLRIHLTDGSVQDVAQMEPLKIAQQWNIDTGEALRLFLYATKTGLLNLSWNVICPNCRVSKKEYTSLSDLESQFHCDLCGINYDANFDQFVELTFSVHPSIREAYAKVYCIGGPTITPHILTQKVITKGNSFTLAIPASEEQLQLRVLQANAIVLFDSNENAPNESSLNYTDSGWSHSIISDCSEIKINNNSSEDILLALELKRPNKRAITAAQVTALQEFRDLFSSEVLSPNQKIEINNVTILFTDLKESTSLYETIGDANAFGQVRDHFKFITEIVRTNKGSVVKTIGDAVMAVFHLPKNGLKAALDIQQGLAAYNIEKQHKLVLKVGLFNGPAIVVNSNDRLDYYGRTVNIAGRIQGQSKGNDIIISQELLHHPETKTLLSENDLNIQYFSIVLKGMKRNMNLVRLGIKESSVKDLKDSLVNCSNDELDSY